MRTRPSSRARRICSPSVPSGSGSPSPAWTPPQKPLTVKSDDVTGRVRTYESIVKGHNVPTPGVPESFKVLVKELQSLCLDIQVLDADGNQIELKEDEDALDTFNLARMDADNERQNRYADEDELADAGFDYVADEEVDASYDDEGDEF